MRTMIRVLDPGAIVGEAWQALREIHGDKFGGVIKEAERPDFEELARQIRDPKEKCFIYIAVDEMEEVEPWLSTVLQGCEFGIFQMEGPWVNGSQRLKHVFHVNGTVRKVWTPAPQPPGPESRKSWRDAFRKLFRH